MGTQLKMGRCQMRNFVVNFSGTTVVAQHLTGVALCAFSALHVLFPLYNSFFYLLCTYVHASKQNVKCHNTDSRVARIVLPALKVTNGQ